ncbi:pilus assembly protein [Chitinibacter tainanensis]|uniref:pilus assembly protein n=1 Tax=Chitinibacter tainanensis TaxID=230667 RepID=UPI0023545811|nr:PilC/PilY family type IV pilus protein [Chitinibacter tainanensis]
MQRTTLSLMLSLLFLPAFAQAVALNNLTQGGRDPFTPLYQSSNEPPLNMLVLGKDHRLYYEAYNDASDLDGDGVYDVGYQGWRVKPGYGEGKGNFKIDYYGYFDSYKCYSYNSSNSRFEPINTTSNKKCRSFSSARWSGDFLNYLTTSRIDAIRRVLYGGKRSTDTASDTVLERTFIPQDAHSWGKEYMSVAFDGYDIQDYTPMASPASGRRHLFANTTRCTPNGCQTSYLNPPLLRTIKDSNRRVWEWVSIERPVADTQYADGSNNRVDIPTSDLTDYVVRVQVCKTGLLEDECKRYGTSYKPYGLIQQYGDAGGMRFGLFTGSYSDNTQGGVLRKNIGSISDEINASDGTFTSTVGIIRNIDKMRIEGFSNSREYYGVSTNDNDCRYGDAFSKQLNNGRCSSWGNPVAEMLWETVKYYAGGSAGYTSDAKGAGVGLSVAAWTDPYGMNGTQRRNHVCAKPVITLISDIFPNFDGDLGNATLNGSEFKIQETLDNMWKAEFGEGPRNVIIGEYGSNNNQAPTTKTATSFFGLRGLPEEPGKAGTFYSAAVAEFARKNDINAAPSKQIVSTFSIALASALPKIEIPVAGQKVVFTPFAKSPSNGGGTGDSTNYRPTNQIVDFYIDTIRNVPGFATDTSINAGRPYYKFRINFEDVEYGGDHDMDAIAEYEIRLLANNTIEVKVNSTYAAGGIDQHMGYVVSGTTKDGVYLVVKDIGGNNVKYWMDALPATTGNPSGTPFGATGNMSALTDTRIFTPNSSASTITDLKSPLWYAAKYGGFIDDEEEDKPKRNVLDNVAEWDADGDGVPDNYFLVTNPLKLKEQLDRAFSRIDATARSSAPVGSTAGSSSQSSEYRIYRTAYRANQWSGNLSALALNTDSLQLSTTYWDANDPGKLIPPIERVLMSWNPDTRTGRAFDAAAEMAQLSSAQKAALNYPDGDPGGFVVTPRMEARAKYIRGDNSNEGTTSGKYRVREQVGNETNYIADILDAQPYAVGPVPRADYYADTGYAAFANQQASRINFVYAGANGGVYHAFMDDVVTNQEHNGRERFGYIPSFVFDKLRKLEEQSYSHEYYLNGQTAVQDVKTDDGTWRTLLAATAGFGGKGLFALDISNPLSVGSSVISSVTRWEFFNSNDTAKGSPDMGYQPYSPLITKMNDGKWYVITGNGFNSTTGSATLFMLDVSGPGSSGWNGKVVKLTVDATIAGNNGLFSNSNGLSAPTAADIDSNGTADYIYAGDMFGNLWKFDVSSTNSAQWRVGLGGKPMFRAVRSDKAQSIVSPPAIAMEKKAESSLSITNKRLMVYFGTGKFYEDCDRYNSSCTGQADTNSVYGIVDPELSIGSDGVMTNAAVGSSYTPPALTSLVEQRIAQFNSADLTKFNIPGLLLSDIEKYRCILPKKEDGTFQSNCSDDNKYTAGIQYGWYANFPLGEERHVGMPRISGGTVIFNTMTPAEDVSNSCAFTSKSGLMALNLDDGGQSRPRFVITNSGTGTKVSINNVGFLSTTSTPNGTTTIKGSIPSGLNDERGFGRNYNGKKSTSACEKAIDVDPLGNATQINVCDSRVVVPVNWSEVIK